ncbi:hypothetical protein EK21DRAFT_58027 [Setomelanomma holmii]|uniref:Guanine nucleotide-exchange factor SEC12 n=1 Tax=Setomelanomma holmii TaxID=210430 RepID=A0A9P4HEK8_9PLEO|nr:hypothetical protein EK21DRAFT_58027 [Setomelanomma holmii]
MSRPTISKAQTSYPLYAASWATSRPSHLIVGGGGGAGKHGVKNQISVFDFSSRAPKVEPVAEHEVSQEDSVTCLANLANGNDSLIVYAGNSSSVDEKLKGGDMHFKAFEVKLPTSKPADLSKEKSASITPLSKTQLFATPKSESARREVYQRLIRLSPPQRSASGIPNKRIGAIATGLAGEENEMVIFGATSNRPEAQDIITRVQLSGAQEANDVDILDQNDGQFKVAYITDHDVYVQDVDFDFARRQQRTSKERRKAYSVPHPDVGDRKGKPRLRGVRWLSNSHLLLLSNKYNRTGVELVLLHLYEEGLASVISRKTLPKHAAAATDMDVSLLAPSEADGAYQVVVAVGAIDRSLSVFTLDYHGSARDSFSSFHKYATYEDVHPLQMTKVVFSPFYKPDTTLGKPQYLRLASTSLGNTISVDTFTLQLEGPHWVLQTARTRRLYTAATYLTISVIVAALALLIQSLLDPEGTLTKAIVPASLRNVAGRTFGEGLRAKRHEAVLNNADTPALKIERRIRDLLHLHNPPMGSSSSVTEKALVIHHDPGNDGELSTEVHEGHEEVLKKHAEAKRWDELSHEDQQAWKQKLQDAGMWAVGEGETILKSIFFGQIGGLVGQVAQGVIG